MNQIFMIYKIGGGIPTTTHDTLQEAQDEAKRLSEKHPGEEFHIIASVDVVKTEKPVTEVGDVVKCGSCSMPPHSECIISAIGTHNISLFNANLTCVCCPEKSKPTLIRKGPSEQVFENVSWGKDDNAPCYPLCEHGFGDTLAEMVRNEKRFDMILRERKEDTK